MSLSHDVFLITEAEYPKLFKAFEIISHDQGNGAGHTNYPIPLAYKGVVKEMDTDLGYLTEAELETLCIGEESESQAIVVKYRIQLLDKLLQEFSEEWS